MSDMHLTPAVQYLRMSTEHQRYSLDNQAAAIAQHASARGFVVHRTYVDAGRSGLTLDGRPGLKSLLADVLSPDREFSAILVLDVSRWGRFQDVDQAAHYEFICRSAGVQVIYCAEPFENDGSVISAIVKQMKRLMAAEYSRELSEKVFRAHLQQAKLGFSQGGARTFGVRRLVIDAAGEPRFVLEPGSRKALTTDRVVLIPGPPDELRTVRRIFRDYVQRGRAVSTIARHLNAEGIVSAHGGPWTNYLVRGVLKSELMIGEYVYNRTFQQMTARRRRNPQSAWVRVKIMEPIVPRKQFERAAIRLKSKARERPDGRTILAGLRRLLREKGILSRRLVDACPYLPSTITVRRCFGSMEKAYRRVGYVQVLPAWLGPDGRPASNDELIARLHALHARDGRVTGPIIDADPSVPTATVYCKRFGSLARAYELAGIPYTRSAAHLAAYLRSVANGTAPIRRDGHLVSRFTDDDCLAGLRRISARDGRVNRVSIDAEPGLPSAASFHRRFGSLLKAYELAGLPFDVSLLRAAARRRQASIAG